MTIYKFTEDLKYMLSNIYETHRTLSGRKITISYPAGVEIAVGKAVPFTFSFRGVTTLYAGFSHPIAGGRKVVVVEGDGARIKNYFFENSLKRSSLKKMMMIEKGQP